MTLRPARCLPDRNAKGNGRKSFVEHDVREFVRTGAQVAIVEIKGHEPKQVANTIRYYIKRHPETCGEIAVALRGGSRTSTGRKRDRWPS